jgi:8-oxo-dGTP diphosphatase
MKKRKSKSRRQPIEAAGGIVMRGRVRPLFAVVQLRRQKSWVLPKGKLNRNETALAAAKREAIEETGHDVEVHEFLGSLAYKSAGRPKTVKFWRMQASGRPVAKLMRDVRAVRWLSLAQATARLSHEREKLFLEKAGRRLARQPSLPKRKARKSGISGAKKAASGGRRAVPGKPVKRPVNPPEGNRREAVPASASPASSVFRSLTVGRKPPALVRKIWSLLRR